MNFITKNRSSLLDNKLSAIETINKLLLQPLTLPKTILGKEK